MKGIKPGLRRAALANLIAARDLIADESRWTRNAMARSEWAQPDPRRTAQGPAVEATSKKAIRWSADGALIVKSRNLNTYMAATVMLLYLVPERKGSILAFNDSHTHAEVLALFDRAITKNQERTHD